MTADHSEKHAGLTIESRAVRPFDKNGFVVSCPTTREGILIDPGDEVEQLLAYAHHDTIVIRHILLTHAHVDHISGVAAAKRRLDAPVYLHRDDLFLYERAVEMGAMFGMDVEPQPPPDRFYAPGERIPFGRLEVQWSHTPGHCPGGVCLAVGPAGIKAADLFVGDTLFAGSIGRTDLPGGNMATLLASIRQVLFPYGDDARVYPGHGPFTTIGRERHANQFLTGLV
jgi:glyoxylase-like metal-dependent hydrolase (beta-lactamase superfamily II)